jgi:hypothetical protein
VKSSALYLILALAVLAAGVVAATAHRDAVVPADEPSTVPEVTSVAARPAGLLPEVVVTAEVPRCVMPVVTVRAARPTALHAISDAPRPPQADWVSVQD